MHDFPLFCKHAQINEGLDHRAFFEQIALFPVVRLRGLRSLIRHCLAGAEHLPLRTDADLVFTRCIPAVILAKMPLQRITEEARHLLLRQLFMKDLFLRVFFQLETALQTVQHNFAVSLCFGYRVAQNAFIDTIVKGSRNRFLNPTIHRFQSPFCFYLNACYYTAAAKPFIYV